MKSVRIFRSRPDVGFNNVVVALSDDNGETWNPIAMVQEIQIESAIVNRSACQSVHKSNGDFDIFDPIIRAEYWADGKPPGEREGDK